MKQIIAGYTAAPADPVAAAEYYEQLVAVVRGGWPRIRMERTASTRAA